jgi:hypothetical protein
MLKTIYNKILIITAISIMIMACGKDPVFDFFVGGQPNFIGENKFVPGLNIFGVIRPDNFDTLPRSFIHVEKVIHAVSEVPDTFTVKNAHVKVYKIENNVAIDSVIFEYGNPDSLFTLFEYRPYKFTPKAGAHYKVICVATDLPELTAQTTVPSIPRLEGDTILKSENSVQFSIVHDSSAAMYDIYLEVNENSYTKRVVREESGNTYVEIDGPILTGAQLTIYAYDINLSEYFAAANLSFKPNTYRPPFSNVNNGYGCFGSMNILKKKIY